MEILQLKFKSANKYRIWMLRIFSKFRKAMRRPISLNSEPRYFFCAVSCFLAVATLLILMVDPVKPKFEGTLKVDRYRRPSLQKYGYDHARMLRRMGMNSMIRRLDRLLDKKNPWKGKLAEKLTKNLYDQKEAAKASHQMILNAVKSNRIVQIIERENEFWKDSKETPCPPVKPDCPIQTNLKTRLNVTSWMNAIRIKLLSMGRNYVFFNHPGIWSPEECTSRHSVAVIIPFRKRKKQLHLLLQHLPVILKRQKISYSIFVVEQVGYGTFNKGVLMNAGFLTALAHPAHGVPFHCFIFHDVDLISEDDRNMYTCPEYPTHMSYGVDELGYDLPYQELAGGVLAIRTEHFLQVNGYSNLYWGWGGEDDDMGLRLKQAFGRIRRPPIEIGRYTSVLHAKQIPAPLDLRRRLNNRALTRYNSDGLNSVKYELVKVVKKKAYSHIFVDVGHPPDNRRFMWKSYGMGCHSNEMKEHMALKLLQELKEAESEQKTIQAEINTTEKKSSET